MSGKIRFISDLHFNHVNIATLRGFKNVDDMNEHIIDKFNSTVRKRDSTYILGDITRDTSKGYELLDRLKGYKFIVMGNHERRQDSFRLIKHCNGLAGAINMKRYRSLVTHIPVHPREFEYRCEYNIHGHLHEHMVTKEVYRDGRLYKELDKRYINVSVEALDYTPMTFEELKEFYRIK